VLHCGAPEAAEINAALLRDVVGTLVTQLYYNGYEVDALLAAVKRSEIQVDGARADFLFNMTREEIAATAKALRAEPTSRTLDSIEPGLPGFSPEPIPLP
jgi:hypothetical protein